MKTYPIDSATLTLDEFCFHSRARIRQTETRGKFRDVVDAFRTIFWFHGLRRQLRAHTTYRIEKLLEPEAFIVREDGKRYRWNRWGRYRMGRHTPSMAFVTEIDQRCEGSQSEFDLVLWDVLRLELPAVQHASEWIRRLEPKVQALLWQKETRHDAGPRRHHRLGTRQLKMLERRGGIDALACLTLLLREAHEQGFDEYAFEVSRWVCRMLVVTSCELKANGIAMPLLEFYEKLILPLAAFGGMRQTLSGVNLSTMCGWLSHALYHLSGVDALKLEPGQERTYQQKILDGDYGYDYFHLFNPIPVPSDEFIAPEDPLYRYWDAENHLRLWARWSVENYRHERFPPNELWLASMAAWREVKTSRRVKR